MKKFILTDGQICIMREATVEDATVLIDYIKKVSGETENLTFSPEEYYTTVEEEIKRIYAMQEQKTSLMLLAFVGGKLTGCLSLSGNSRPRLQHSATFGISILWEHWGIGLGKALIEEMIMYARKVGLTKLNLKVRVDNTRGIRLYKHFGFCEEGVERRSMCIDGEYIDCLLMGLLLD